MISVFYCIIISLVFALTLFTVNKILIKYRHKNTKTIDLSSYECGSDNDDSPYYVHKFNFFLIAVIFLIFEIEIIFILPFITIFKNKNLHSLNNNFQNFIFIEMFIFIAVLAIGLLYIIKRKYLNFLK